MAFSQIADQFGLFNGHGAENHPVQAAGQQRFGPFGAAHATPELHGNRQGRRDLPNHGVIDGLPGPGTIEIDQMQPLRPLLLPGQGLGNRVIAETGDLLVITLMKPDALSVKQIDGGDDLHGSR